MFQFIKKVFFVGWTVLSGLTNVNSLSYISMNNQKGKQDLILLMLIAMSLYFILLVSKQVNVVVVVIILMIRMQKYVFLIL